MKIGRNEPCPCGSGKKYKRCCGAGVQHLPPSGVNQEAAARKAAEEEAASRVTLERATRAAKKLLRGGSVEDAEKAAAEVLVAKGLPRQDARKEARLIVSETLGVLEGERDMKNAENRAQRAGRKAFDGSRESGEDIIACRQKARSAILASFESAGMGFDPQAPIINRLLDKIAPPSG